MGLLMPSDNQANNGRRRHSLSNQLKIWFLALSLIPLCLGSWLSYKQAHTSRSEVIANELAYSSRLTARFSKNFFDSRFLEIKSQASNQSNIDLMQSLNMGLQQSGTTAPDYVGSEGWSKRVDLKQDDLIRLTQYYNFIHDIFLIDDKGNILFTVLEEDDIGSNLNHGIYANTLFAKTYQNTVATNEVLFSDLERYAPSNNLLSGFLTAPLLNAAGETVGVFAIQIDFSIVIKGMVAFSFSDTKHYLVGSDGLIRTNNKGNQDEILKRAINTKNFESWQKNNSLNSSLKNNNKVHSDDYISPIMTYKGPDQVNVIGLYNTLPLHNHDWILISEINEAAAFADVTLLGKKIIGIIVFTAIGLLFIAIYLAQKITRPITELTEASKSIARGDTDQKVSINADNEIGVLADAFNLMIEARLKSDMDLQTSHDNMTQALNRLNGLELALNQHSIVSITDDKGIIISVNDKILEVSGYSSQELIGSNHTIHNSNTHNQAFWDAINTKISRGNPWHGVICNQSKSGNLYWIESSIVPLMNEGQPYSFIALGTDITYLKETEESLIIAKQDAEAATKIKSEFLASMSHEIRTPMNGVLGMIGLLLNENLSNSQKHKAQLVQSSAESLLTIINDVLDFSKMEAGKMELELLDFDIRKLMGDFAESIALQAQDKNIELILDTKNIDHAMVKGDSGKIRQVLFNLVGNAIKFTANGEVVIQARTEELSNNKLKLHCKITDTGIGIPKDKQDNLFDEFTQVDASTTREYGGTGLGLSIVKKLCLLMDGDIEVQSELGQGSEFSFNLILHASQKPKLVVPTISIENLSVFIVDDNKTNREVLTGQLSHWGIQVTQACDGPSAIALLKEHYANSKAPFDVAILDMQMPGMDGAELGKLIRQDAQFDDIKLVMMTSMGSSGDEAFFATLGFNAYFPKPVTTSDLFDALAVVVENGEVLRASSIVTRNFLRSLTTNNNSDSTPIWPTKTRLLLVEDNTINQEVALGILEEIDLQAETAINGIEALDSLKNTTSDQPYTLILMDCQMAQMDGYETSRRIRSGQAGPHYTDIPIIAMTANAMQGDREKCLDAGMSDYLTKPINPQHLLERLVTWLFQEKSQAQLTKQLPTDQNNKIDKQAIADRKLVWGKESALKRMRGRQDRLLKIIDLFISDMPQRIVDLKNAAKNNNHNEIELLAHTIKGVAVNLDGNILSAAAAALEKHIKEGDFDNSNQLLLLLEQTVTAYDDLYDCLSEYRDKV